MDSTLLIPPLFPVEAVFEDLQDGALIRVARPDGEHVGILRVTRQPDPPRLGALVCFGPSEVTGRSTPPSMDDRGFAATSHAGFPVHRFTLDELRAIKRTGEVEVPLALDLPQP